MVREKRERRASFPRRKPTADPVECHDAAPLPQPATRPRRVRACPAGADARSGLASRNTAWTQLSGLSRGEGPRLTETASDVERPTTRVAAVTRRFSTRDFQRSNQAETHRPRTRPGSDRQDPKRTRSVARPVDGQWLAELVRAEVRGVTVGVVVDPGQPDAGVDRHASRPEPEIDVARVAEDPGVGSIQRASRRRRSRRSRYGYRGPSPRCRPRASDTAS